MNATILGLSFAALTIALPAVFSPPNDAAPAQGNVVGKPTAQAAKNITWRTDLAAAIEESKRTNRPLLAVFR